MTVASGALGGGRVSVKYRGTQRSTEETIVALTASYAVVFEETASPPRGRRFAPTRRDPVEPAPSKQIPLI